ncbi:MAG: hypothetical protein WED09_12015 [Homoserinimonas sp.]
MSTFRNPVGPQAPQVYWRRRLMVGLGLLAVVVVVLLIVFRPAGAATDDQEPGTDGAPASTTEPTDEPVQEEGAACNPENIELKAVTDKSQYASGQQPMISMSIVNNGSVACVADVGTDKQLYEITSGAETYWLSTDCQAEQTPQKVALEPGVAQSTTPITWDRTRSDPSTCENERKAVTAAGASYHLTVSLGDIKSEKTAQFLLY